MGNIVIELERSPDVAGLYQMPSRIRKAVIPAIGLGFDFFPATYAMPEEMLTVAGKPLLQYAVEEAAASGIETVVLVAGKGKNILADHFRRNPTLESILIDQHQMKDVLQLRRLSQLAEIRSVSLKSGTGLADAVLSARSAIGDEPFAVIVPTEIVEAAVPCTKQLMGSHAKHGGCVIATQGIKPCEAGRFGIMELLAMSDPCCGERTQKVTGLAVRSNGKGNGSPYGILGRYILEPQIFSCIETQSSSPNSDLQLTGALARCLAKTPIHAFRFQGKHYPISGQLELLKANIALSLKDSAIAQPLLQFLSELQYAAGASAH